ncbi:25727_t:CDS:2, partial [Gigaspora rosea]
KPSDNQLQNSTNQPLTTQFVESFQQPPKKTSCIHLTRLNEEKIRKNEERARQKEGRSAAKGRKGKAQEK